MGNTRSEFFEPVSVDLWWNNDQANTSEPEVVQINQQTINKANEDKMAEIKQEISSLHEKRLRLIAEKKKEMDGLRQELARHKKQNEELKGFIREKGYEPPIQEWDVTKVDVSLQTETFEVPGNSNPQELEHELGKIETIRGKNLELQINIAELQKELQGANSELAAFENERKEYKTHVTALKDIIAVSKQLLLMRENQIKELTQKVAEIQASLAEKELQAFSEDLRQEYARQLQNIKQLRVLYEERQRADKTERNNLKTQLEEAQSSLKILEPKNSELQERVDELEKDNSNKYDNLISLESQLGLTKAECGELRAEMSVINQLFSQILMGFNNGQDIDMDKLIKTLEENHDLLTDIVINEESNELSSALPKVLLDLVSQVNEKTKAALPSNPQEESNSAQGLALATIAEESESQTSTQQNSLSSASEIVQNLPKVWKVLAELLSHQSAPVSVLNENNDQSDSNPCYKSVQTPTGTTMVLSVSQTYIRLKDLIVEKKSLEKETTRLKQLNTHLETRLQDQEKRLEMVSHELSKTWHVVGKMQKQHQQLHTQEKILRYELAQKRKLLNELKEELEYCREKWLQAREKNSTTEEQWKQLRNEFAARKNTISEDLNNSVESGYSDERESSSDDEVEDVTTPGIGAGCSGEGQNLGEVIDAAVGEVDESSNAEENSETILGVIKDEIASIENGAGFSGDGPSAQSWDDVQANDLVSQEQDNFAEIASDLDDAPTQLIRTNENSADPLENKEEVPHCEVISIEDSSSTSFPSVSEHNQLENIVAPLELDVVSAGEITTEESSDSSSSLTEGVSSTNDDEATILNYRSLSGIQSNQLENGVTSLEHDVASTGEESSNRPSLTEDTSSTISSCPSASRIEPIQLENSVDPLELDVALAGEANTEDVSSDSSSSLTEGVSSTNDDEPTISNWRQPSGVHFTPLELGAGSTGETNTANSCSSSLLMEETPFVIKEDVITKEMEDSLTSPAMDDEIFTQPMVQTEDVTMNSAIDQSELENSVKTEDDVEEIVLNEDGSTEEAEPLKTDLVQNQEVQKDAIEAPKTHEEILAAREERLKRLEEQAKDLIAQRTNTSNRGDEICTKLDDLHEQYGGDQKSRRKDIDDIYKKLEEDILQTIKKTQGVDEYPSTSRQSRSTEEILAAREQRLTSLEEQSNALVNQAARTSHRGKEISSKLDSLHQLYGDSGKNQEEVEKPDDATTSRVEEEPSTSATRTPEEILAGREERLQKMEEQAQQLVSKARRNSFRNLQFCSKLNKLHDRYGDSSDSSDDGADDNNNNNNADGVQDGDEMQNEDVSVNNEAQLDLEDENAQRGEEEQP